MDFFITRAGISNTQLWLYNIAMIVYFVYLFWRYRKHNIATYIIFLFTVGVFTDLSRLIGFASNTMMHIYLVISFAWGGMLLNKYGFKSKNSILISFVVYLLYFVVNSVVIHGDNIPLIVSQSLKYSIPVITFFVAESYMYGTRGKGVIVLNHVLKNIILAQIIFCAIKLIVLQATQEGLVGSLTGRDGGGAGTSFPLLCMLWLGYVTKMKFSKKFFFYLLGFFFIGFMTGKRAVWLLLPVEIIILYLYYKVKDFSQLLKYIFPAIILGCLFLYAGLRLSPTLNPDKKVGGRFDLEYAYNYALTYSGGSETNSGQTEVKEGDGRLGAALLFWNRATNIFDYNQETLVGVGNEKIKYYDKTKYFDKDANMGVSYRGGVTGVVFMFFISGIVGVILFLSYFFQILLNNRRESIAWILLAVTMFDFVFYNGQIVNNVAMQSMLFLIILICRIGVLRNKSNKVYEK